MEEIREKREREKREERREEGKQKLTVAIIRFFCSFLGISR